MVYSGPNRPIAPIDDPYQMFERLYGQMKDKQTLVSVLDDLKEDFKKLNSRVSAADRKLLDQNANFVREMERELKLAERNTESTRSSRATCWSRIVWSSARRMRVSTSVNRET